MPRKVERLAGLVCVVENLTEKIALRNATSLARASRLAAQRPETQNVASAKPHLAFRNQRSGISVHSMEGKC